MRKSDGLSVAHAIVTGVVFAALVAVVWVSYLEVWG
jgi:hypothetical protein